MQKSSVFLSRGDLDRNRRVQRFRVQRFMGSEVQRFTDQGSPVVSESNFRTKLFKSQIPKHKSQINLNNQNSKSQTFWTLRIEIWNLPFDVAQGGESFDFAQDREPVERLVEPLFVNWCLEFC